MFNKQIMILFLAASLTFFACDDDKKASSETDLCTVAGAEVVDMGTAGEEPVAGLDSELEPEAGVEVLQEAGEEPEAGNEPVAGEPVGGEPEPEAGVEVLPEAGTESLPEDPTAGSEEDQPLPG